MDEAAADNRLQFSRTHQCGKETDRETESEGKPSVDMRMKGRHPEPATTLSKQTVCEEEQHAADTLPSGGAEPSTSRDFLCAFIITSAELREEGNSPMQDNGTISAPRRGGATV
ncbi:unnamed protein product [Boreogadus saida]